MASFTGAWHTVQPYLDPGNMLKGDLSIPGNPGGDVGAAQPTTGAQLQRIPGTNFSYDPATGQYYQSSMIDPNTGQVVDLGASQVAQAPNLAQQGSGAAINQNSFLGQQADVVARMAATRAGENGLANDYLAAIHGTGPSVAGTQLLTGMNRIGQDQNSMAAGANGQNAFAARRAAAMNIARASGDLSGQQALVRANETAAARSGLASLYGSEASADQAANSNATQAAVNYGGLDEKAEADRIGANTSAAEGNAKAHASFLMGVGGGVGSFFGGKG